MSQGRHSAGPSLLWKILLSTSVAITLLIGVAGWFEQNQTRAALTRSLESEVRSSLQAYESLFHSRADLLRSVSTVLSSMSDVRAAFQTSDKATIRDTAAEIWSRISQSSALFVVTDPAGDVIASLGGGDVLGNRVDAVTEAARHFPSQTAGFALAGNRLYELVVTPVYVQGQAGQGLLNVLVAGFPVDESVATQLKQQTGGSDFLFLAAGKPVASTLAPAPSQQIVSQYRRAAELQRVQLDRQDYAILGSALRDVEGAQVGDLLIVRNFEPISNTIDALQKKLLAVWATAVLAGLAVSFLLAHRILRPIRQLDTAAEMISRQEYATRVPEESNDEIGRLAHTFNDMAKSIQDARGELIRQERILTIGRLSSSIVHDLRNPLASIYGGAEMMMDGNLSEAQMHRIAGTIYRSSRVINDLLQELLDVSRGRVSAPENCRLSEIVSAAVELQSGTAEENGVKVNTAIDPTIELPLERARMERVFLNLISNAIEAMPEGGKLDIRAERNGVAVLIRLDDTGPGIPAAVRTHLFEPFVTSRKNGLGLGLALSRQAVLEHGGDLWIEEADSIGAHFRLRLPLHDRHED